jgi:hypothetical protein
MTLKVQDVGLPRPDKGDGGSRELVGTCASDSPVSSPTRCPVVICDLRRDGRNSKSGKEKRVRCIHPKGHWGPHVFGGVR